MVKLVLLIAACVFGSALCETHNQQKRFANYLVEDMEVAAKNIEDMLEHYDEHTPEGKNLILIHANSFNFNVHYVLDSLQYVIAKFKGQPGTLQEIVLKLNSITFELEKTFPNGAGSVKTQLSQSAQGMVREAKNLRQIVSDNQDQAYTGTVLRLLDDLVTATQMAPARDALRRKPKAVVKSMVRIAKKLLTATLNSINSTDVNVYKDIVQYSSRFSSVVSETRTMLRDLTFTYRTNKVEEVKEVVYFLSKIVRANDEVLYKETSFNKIKEQFEVSITDLAAQLDKMVDAGYSDQQTMQDDNIIYVVLPYILNYGNQLQRNFEKTIKNYINPSSDSEYASDY